MNDIKPWQLITIIAIVSISLLVRLHHLDYESLWMDEIRQVFNYSLQTAEVVQGAAEQSQPPLDYLIGHFIYKYFQSDFSVRLPSALFGSATVLLIIIIVATLCSWPVALLTGFIAALLPFNIYYSQEVRPYAIAVFLFVMVLWLLVKSLSTDRSHLKNGIVLFAVSVLFLYSRALSPLMVISVLSALLFIYRVFWKLIGNKHFPEVKTLMIYPFLAFIFSLIVYVPYFKYIMKASGQYLSDSSMTFGYHHLLRSLSIFDMCMPWKTFAVQTEPLTIPFLLLVIASPFFARSVIVRQKHFLYSICAILLPGTLITHALVFYGKTNSLFRPPYAIYLLPLVLILAAVSVQGIWKAFTKLRRTRLAQSVLVFCVILLMIALVRSTFAVKEKQNKSDWKGVSEYIHTHMDSKQMLIFQSVQPYGRPTFNGFPRYYKGKTKIISMAQVPYIPADIMKSNIEPVIILFFYRDYYLTQNSKYPILPLPQGVTNIELNHLARDDSLATIQFTGFSIIRLKSRKSRFSNDAYTLIKKMEDYIPENSSQVELQLAAAALAKRNNEVKWLNHMDQAIKLSNKKYHDKLKNIRRYIGNSK